MKTEDNGEGAASINHITFEIAKQFLENEGSVDLSEATTIDDDAADALGERDDYDFSPQLFLNGLTKISNAAAESLSKNNNQLFLDGLTEISDAAAESLCAVDHEGTLSLNGLTEISDSIAELMSRGKKELNLGGLIKISDAAAKSLSWHKGDLFLDDGISLSDAAAKSLSKREGEINYMESAEWVKSIRD
ncbi:hypothetical protein N9017_02215 [Akkermansiaceae bacterium]|nr:hypothetical protein [Akkermansiaceae bacterium]